MSETSTRHTKRSRVESPDPQDSDPQKSQEIQQSGLWFTDGNIILQAQNIQFRFYKGLLSSQSEVFRDMFRLGQPSSDEMAAECPVVHVSDNPDDLMIVLMAIHDRRFFRETEPQEFDTIAALIRLGRKYQLDQLYKDAMHCLQLSYPTELDQWQADGVGVKFGLKPYHSLPFDVIKLANELELRHVLPSAYYDCVCRMTNEEILDGIEEPDNSVTTLDWAGQRCCIIGREKFMKNQSLLFWIDKDDKNCGDSPCMAWKQVFGRHIWKPGTRPLALSRWSTAWDDEMCPRCSDLGKKAHRKCRKLTWEKLPSFFALPDWEVLKKEYSASSGN